MIKVSVLMSVYNGEKYLNEAISSVLNQTEKNLELVIVNDGSSDGTDAIIKSHVDPRIKYLNLPHVGRVPALNAGLEKCQGEYIAILDADDAFEEDKLEKQIAEMDKRGLILSGTWAKIIDENGNETGNMTYPPVGERAIRTYSLMHNPFIHSTVVARRKEFLSVGPYRALRGVEDYDLLSKVIFKYKADNLPLLLTKYRRHSSQATQNTDLVMRINGLFVRMLILFRFLSS